jgi:hypothetical protein
VTVIGYGAFVGCTDLTGLTVSQQNPAYSSRDGVLFDKKGVALIRYPAGRKGNYAIPAAVTVIDYGSFAYCTGLTSVSIPASVTEIGGWAFSDCTGLTSMSIPVNVTEIGDQAFAGCTGLTAETRNAISVRFGDGVFDR